MRTLLFSVAFAVLLAGCDGCNGTHEVDPKEKAEGLYILATAHYLQGNFDQAIDLLNQSKQLNPNDPRLPAAYGEIHLSQGKLNEAEQEFTTEVKQDPKRATNWSRLGYIQAQLGKREEARSSVRKALSLNPEDFNALEQLGEIDLKDGNADDAVKHLVMAAEAAPDLNKKDLYLRATDILVSKKRDPEAALLLKQAVTRFPNLPGEIFAKLGELSALQGDVQGALQAYTVAAKRLPHDPIPWEIVGEIDMHLDKPGDAEAAWRESLRIEDRAIIHVQLARMYLKRNDPDTAKSELEQALKTAKGEDKRETVELADLLAEMKREKDAIALLKVISSEQENHHDVELQLKLAKLAKQQRDLVTTAEACARVVDAGVSKCP